MSRQQKPPVCNAIGGYVTPQVGGGASSGEISESFEWTSLKGEGGQSLIESHVGVLVTFFFFFDFIAS